MQQQPFRDRQVLKAEHTVYSKCVCEIGLLYGEPGASAEA